MRFLITGLPRSRTAWFAAYFSQGDTLCYHEASFFDYDMQVPFTHLGNAEAGVSVKWLNEFDPQKIVVVHRDLDEIERSLKKIEVPVDRVFLEALEKGNSALKGLHVAYDDITKSIKGIHDWLELPGYSSERAFIMNDMNIQSKYWR